MIRLKGTGYLGLQHHSSYQKAVTQGMSLFGVNNPQSRNNPGDFAPLEAVEASLVEDWKTDWARLLPNGFLAGLVMRDIANKSGCSVYVDPRGHRCYSRNSDELRPEPMGDYFLLVDAADPMSGHAHWLTDPNMNQDLRGAAWVAVDMSHAFGLWEPEVFWKHWPIPLERTFLFGSLGKATAFPAGFILGPKGWEHLLTRHPAFTTAAPPANAHAHAYLETAQLKAELRTRLWRHWDTFVQKLSWPLPRPRAPGVDLALDAEAHRRLIASGIEIGALAYPDALGPRRYRAAFDASLSSGQWDKIAQEFGSLNIKPHLPEY